MSKLDHLDDKLSGYHQKNKHSRKSAEAQTEIDRLETNFLGWLTIAGIFIIGAGVIKDLVDYGKYYSLTFLIIVIIILTVTFNDYLSERERLNREGIIVPYRLNWLAGA